MCAAGLTASEAIRIAASVEQYSRHLLAQPILERAQREKIMLVPVAEVSEKPGQRLTARVEGTIVHITGRKQLQLRAPAVASDLPPARLGMECISS